MTDKRTPPAIGYHANTAMRLDKLGTGYLPTFLLAKIGENGITAEQAREAAHLLNQLAEYLEST